ncbi:MAG: DUF6067 family protein [Firmicutes bacterium]|nr:DUF6067 family protein [Bacillota bacterium]
MIVSFEHTLKAYSALKWLEPLPQGLACPCAFGKDIIFAKSGLFENVISRFNRSGKIDKSLKTELFYSAVEAYSELSGKRGKATAELTRNEPHGYKIALSGSGEEGENLLIKFSFKAPEFLIVGGKLYNSWDNFKPIAIEGYNGNIFAGQVNCGAVLEVFGNRKIAVNKTEQGIELIISSLTDFDIDISFTPFKEFDFSGFTAYSSNSGKGGALKLKRAKCKGVNYLMLSEMHKINSYKSLESAVSKIHKHGVGAVIPLDSSLKEMRYEDALGLSVHDISKLKDFNFIASSANFLVENLACDGFLIEAGGEASQSDFKAISVATATKKGRKAISVLSTGSSVLDSSSYLPYADKAVIKDQVSNTPYELLALNSGFLYGVEALATCVSSPILLPLTGMRLAPKTLGFKSRSAVKINKIFNNFLNGEAKIFGFWDNANPFTADRAEIRVTSYISGGNAVVIIYNESDKKCEFDIGVNPRKGFTLLGKKVKMPYISGVQFRGKTDFNSAIVLGGKKGIVLTVQSK